MPVNTERNTGFASDSLAAGAGPFVVRSAEVIRISIPLVEPFRISSGEVRGKDAVIVRLGDGPAFGWGEASAMAGTFYCAETPDTCQLELLNPLIPSILGRRFDSVLALNAHLAALSSNRFACAALETAAWELVARSRGASASQLLRVAPRPVPSGLAVGLYDSEAELLSAIRRLDPGQYRRLKIKIKRGQDVALVRAVRREFGSVPLFVDANADYSRDDFGIFEELDGYGLMMFEQPLAKGDLEGSALLQRRVRTPVCLDESIDSAASARDAIRMGACRIVNLKLQRVGGLTEGLRICEVCCETGTPLWMGTMPELGIGSAQALALASHPAFVLPTDVEPSRRWYVDDILEPALDLLPGGEFQIPSAPGWGYDVSRAKIDRYAIQRWTM